MAIRLGIGIVTYNRRELLSDTIDKVVRLTRHAETFLAIADDGSTDGTAEMLLARGLPVVTGVNMGIAWNKNRALYWLSHMLNCDMVLVLEDDSQPDRFGWEAEWIAAIQKYGHVNYAAPWLREYFLSGAGTAEDPVRSTFLTAQCAGYSRAALAWGGYLDSRFRGYGHEHIEHTARLIRAGFGGVEEKTEHETRSVFDLIAGDIVTRSAVSFHNQEQVDRNLAVATELVGDENYRAPWRNSAELLQFRGEIESCMARYPDGFRLKDATRSAALGLSGRPSDFSPAADRPL